MKNSSEFSITSKQLIFIMVGCMLGTGVLSLPRLAAKELGQDAWFSVILGMLLPLTSLSLINTLYKNSRASSFVSMCRENGGSLFGGALSILLALYSMASVAVILRLFIEVISVFLLDETPLLAQLVIMLTVCAYLACSNAKVAGRVNEFLFYVLLPLVFFSLPAVIINSDVRNLMPLFNHTLTDYSKGALATGFAFQGYELYFVFRPFTLREKEAYGAGIYAVLITMAIYLYFVIGAIMVFGSELTQKLTWPPLRLLVTTEVPVFERVEFLFIQAWIGVSFRPISNQYFCASHVFTELFKLKSQKWAVLAMFPFIIGIAYYPQNMFQVFKLSDYIGVSAIIIGIALPVVLLISSFIVKKGGAKVSGNT